MQDTRALLDSLMGPSRNKPKDEQKIDEWKERDCCKRFLVGFCPNNQLDNWFKNTRGDIFKTVCTKIHSQRLREDYLAHPDRLKYEEEYERDFLHYLDTLIAESDQVVAREKRNCREGGREVEKMPPSVYERVVDMRRQCEDLMKRAENLAEEGNLDESKLAMRSSEDLRADIDRIRKEHTMITEKDEVCEICGIRCMPGGISDFQAHLDGKLHIGFASIRGKAKELREKFRHRPDVRRHEPPEERGATDRKARERSREKDRDKERSRSRDREKDREKRSRSREKMSRSRDRRKKDRKDKSRSRGKSKSRERDRKRERSRSRKRRR